MYFPWFNTNISFQNFTAFTLGFFFFFFPIISFWLVPVIWVVEDGFLSNNENYFGNRIAENVGKIYKNKFLNILSLSSCIIFIMQNRIWDSIKNDPEQIVYFFAMFVYNAAITLYTCLMYFNLVHEKNVNWFLTELKTILESKNIKL